MLAPLLDGLPPGQLARFATQPLGVIVDAGPASAGEMIAIILKGEAKTGQITSTFFVGRTASGIAQ